MQSYLNLLPHESILKRIKDLVLREERKLAIDIGKKYTSFLICELTIRTLNLRKCVNLVSKNNGHYHLHYKMIKSNWYLSVKNEK